MYDGEKKTILYKLSKIGNFFKPYPKMTSHLKVRKGSKIPINFILLKDYTPVIKNKLFLPSPSINLTNISLLE